MQNNKKEHEYICAYPHCLHHGETIPKAEAVMDKGRYYHWDCLQTKKDIAEIRKIYGEEIDENVNYPILMKVINDLIFKYDLSADFVRFSIEYYANTKAKIKSPFTLLYLRGNEVMERKYLKSAGGDKNRN